MAPVDTPGAGEYAWSTVSGADPQNPLVGGPRVDGLHGNDVDRGGARVVTTPDAQIGPASGAIMATPEATAQMDNWRDIFNWRGSPMPWLLVAALVVLGLMQLRVQARAGPASASAAIG